MPLKKGSSKKTLKQNIEELHKEASPKRRKAIKTIAKKKGISYQKAKRQQAVAIAYAQKRKSKK